MLRTKNQSKILTGELAQRYVWFTDKQQALISKAKYSQYSNIK